jgi:hypothetical protein
MIVAVDQDLVEAVLFRLGRDPSLAAATGYREDDPEREALYQIADPGARNEAFGTYFAHWFHQAGLEGALRSALDEFPLLAGTIARATFRRARSARDEVGELFRGAEGPPRAVFALLPERLPERTHVPILRHECQHLHDILDPAFGYPLDPAVLRQLEADPLFRMRYRVLWDLCVDGRLSRRFPEFAKRLPFRNRELENSFGFLGSPVIEELFKELWYGEQPGHARLWKLATDPRHERGPALPGMPCPLCRFPTFSWAEPARIDALRDAVVRDFPAWTPAESLCARCAEIYAARNMRLPPTIVV